METTKRQNNRKNREGHVPRGPRRRRSTTPDSGAVRGAGAGPAPGAWMGPWIASNIGLQASITYSEAIEYIVYTVWANNNNNKKIK